MAEFSHSDSLLTSHTVKKFPINDALLKIQIVTIFSIEIHKGKFRCRKIGILKSLWKFVLFGVIIETRTSKRRHLNWYDY